MSSQAEDIIRETFEKLGDAIGVQMQMPDAMIANLGAVLQAEIDRIEAVETESFEFLNELALAFRAAENHPRPQYAPVLEGVRAVLAHLTASGRLLRDDEMRLTAEQVGWVSLIVNDSNPMSLTLDAWERVRALFPATEPASYCSKGVCSANEGHDGTCAEASGWAHDAYEDDPARAVPAEEETKAEAIEALTEAIRFTVEYVWLNTLPPIEGWSWYDALLKYAPEKAKAFLDAYTPPVNPSPAEHVTTETGQRIVNTTVLTEVADERARQDAKWGEQNHPDVDHVLMTREGGASPARMAEHYELPTAARAKFLCDQAADFGQVTYAHILIEEVAEVVEAATRANVRELRNELIQVAAVAVAWVEKLDREAASSPVAPAPTETEWPTWEAVPEGVTAKAANGERFRKTGIGAIHLLTNGAGDCCKISVATDLQPAPFVAVEEG